MLDTLRTTLKEARAFERGDFGSTLVFAWGILDQSAIAGAEDIGSVAILTSGRASSGNSWQGLLRISDKVVTKNA